jgi:hypothetical protein
MEGKIWIVMKDYYKRKELFFIFLLHLDSGYNDIPFMAKTLLL